MKKYVTLLLSLSGFLAARAQLQQPKLSPVTRSFLAAVQKQAATNTPPEGFLYKKRNDGQVCISALIKLRDAASAAAVASELKAINATTGTKAGLIWTVQVPVSQVSAFVKISGIAYIQADEPVFPDLYEARKTTRVDSVHKGIALPMPYTGKGVISGIMDFGFDYNHPTLYDTSGHRYRVRKVWEMGTTGTAPAGYSYGHELTDTNLIRAQLTDNDNQTHGAGVAGLAAGSGGGIPADSFRGIAFESDMVFVGVRRDSLSKQWLTGGFSDFVDGVKYIFDAADAAGKPAVANISWGSQSGPHDGTSPINQAFDAMSGKGKVIVMSAGNDGNYGIHLNKTFTLTDTSISTGLTFSNKAYKRTWIDIWGDTAKTFCVTTTLYHGGVAGNSTGSVCIDGNIHDYTLIAANGLDTCYVQVITNPSEYNDKPRVTVNIYNKASDTVAIRVSGTDGSIDMWNEYYYYGYTYGFVSTFSNLGMPGFVTGNVQTTVSDMGAAKSTLLVGAYSTRPPLGAGTAGTLSSFSSRGPMIDGRIKPDITAPGLYVATSYNSEDTAYSYTGSAAGSMVRKCTVGGKDYYYGEFAGTSASAPIASGIVALLMEVDPTLTPERVKDLLFSTAITDIKTGTLPPEGNNNWGHGKINAYGAVRKLVKELSVYSPAAQQLDCVLYPNPGNGRCILDINTDHSEALTISVTGITGNVILERSWKVNSGNNQYPLDISGLAAGMYLVKVSGQGGSATLKAVLR